MCEDTNIKVELLALIDDRGDDEVATTVAAAMAACFEDLRVRIPAASVPVFADDREGFHGSVSSVQPCMPNLQGLPSAAPVTSHAVRMGPGEVTEALEKE